MVVTQIQGSLESKAITKMRKLNNGNEKSLADGPKSV